MKPYRKKMQPPCGASLPFVKRLGNREKVQPPIEHALHLQGKPPEFIRVIIENITLSYGSDMLFQRGLGTRNLIFLLTLYSYFLNDTFKRFNLVCIEEPESHLDISNLKIAIEFFQKAQGKNTLTQLVISTHSNQIMNKLKLTNVILLLDNDCAVDLSNIDPELVYYLAKRENFDTLNMFYASKLIMVEGATEEIYINSLLQRIHHEKTNFLFNVVITKSNRELFGHFNYNQAAFEASFIEKLKNSVSSCIFHVCENPNMSVNSIKRKLAKE